MTDFRDLSPEEKQAVQDLIDRLKRKPALVIDLDDNSYLKVIYIPHKNIFALYGLNQNKPLWLYGDQIRKFDEAFEKGLMDYVDEHDRKSSGNQNRLESNHEA